MSATRTVCEPQNVGRANNRWEYRGTNLCPGWWDSIQIIQNIKFQINWLMHQPELGVKWTGQFASQPNHFYARNAATGSVSSPAFVSGLAVWLHPRRIQVIWSLGLARTRLSNKHTIVTLHHTICFCVETYMKHIYNIVSQVPLSSIYIKPNSQVMQEETKSTGRADFDPSYAASGGILWLLEFAQHVHTHVHIHHASNNLVYFASFQ